MLAGSAGLLGADSANASRQYASKIDKDVFETNWEPLLLTFEGSLNAKHTLLLLLAVPHVCILCRVVPCNKLLLHLLSRGKTACNNSRDNHGLLSARSIALYPAGH
jgi:hypothetical protein